MERIYSVLLVSGTENLNQVLLPLLREGHYQPVQTAASVSEARRLWGEFPYDFVIINSPLPDDPGIRFAVDVSGTGGAALLLVRAELLDEVHDRVCPGGVFTLAKPFSIPAVLTALRFLASARERQRRLEQKTLSFEEKMEEIRLVNRAKWRLISEEHLDEPQAHRRIEKLAMDLCISKRAAAERILSEPAP